MSLLIPNRKGNPKWIKGVAQNPNGRPKGQKYSSIKTTLKKLRRDPVEELIMLADLAKASKNYAMAVGIWKDLHEENSNFPSLEGMEQEGKEAAKKLAELERGDNGNRSGSNSSSMGTGTAVVQAPSSPTPDLSSDTK